MHISDSHGLHGVHRDDSRMALFILAMAVVGFLIYFVMGTPVDIHRTASGYSVAQP